MIHTGLKGEGFLLKSRSLEANTNILEIMKRTSAICTEFIDLEPNVRLLIIYTG
jgi:predicted hotdog family 3-hydroxylacyl-ACP dehydratase